MCHPTDRRARFLIGMRKGEKRALGYWGSAAWYKSRQEREKFLERNAQIRRNTTKLCSCSMCGNPRRVAWKDNLTMQEKKAKDWKSEI